MIGALPIIDRECAAFAAHSRFLETFRILDMCRDGENDPGALTKRAVYVELSA